ncbi:MAG: endonuclease VIII [Myxococcales bacterium]|nr:endonuclease VIII [Myxococcales bacterium]
MPEGPEVRRQADRIRKAMEGRRLDRVTFAAVRLQDWQPELSGRRLLSVDPRGKAILFRFEGGLTIYTHGQLMGRWRVFAIGREPSLHRSLRLGLETALHGVHLYSAFDIDVLDDQELVHHPFLTRLGPDVLDDTTTPEDIRQQLRRFARRSLAALLLDQRLAAGIGNYLRSEILFEAGIRPELRPVDLSAQRLDRLAQAILDVPRRSYRTGGITVDNELAALQRREGVPRRRMRHFVFNRSEEPCRRCGTPIERGELSGRRIYVCPGAKFSGERLLRCDG